MFRIDHVVLLAAAMALAACSPEQSAAPASTPEAAPSPTAEATPAASPTAEAAPPATSTAPEGAEVYFVSPADGDEIEGEVKVVFGLRNMDVAPAGDMTENTGHHHLLIDEPEVSMEGSLPATEQIVHFGGGQTETTVSLEPGEHTLQLLLGDGLHRPHNPPVMSEKITITVK